MPSFSPKVQMAAVRRAMRCDTETVEAIEEPPEKSISIIHPHKPSIYSREGTELTLERFLEIERGGEGV